MARVAHADEMGAGGSGGEMKKKHKSKKKDAGGAGGAKGEMEKK
jgi:hypothetical protein